MEQNAVKEWAVSLCTAEEIRLLKMFSIYNSLFNLTGCQGDGTIYVISADKCQRKSSAQIIHHFLIYY